MTYAFDRTISRPVLENYLSRAISMARLTASPQREEDLRMLANIGAKFIGRSANVWVDQDEEEKHFAKAADIVAAYRRLDTDAIFQACVFEVVSDALLPTIPIPAWVFEEFGRPVERRAFNYEAMLYDSSAAMAGAGQVDAARRQPLHARLLRQGEFRAGHE